MSETEHMKTAASSVQDMNPGNYTSWDECPEVESCELIGSFLKLVDDDIGIVIEVKYADNGDLEAACKKALLQIETSDYDEELRDIGMETILKYGVACYKKRCMVMLNQ